jgi:RNA polymerase sigma-70 factor (sigma-E family)
VVQEAGGFTEFAESRTRALLRSAWLLTGDWHLAQDLVQEALVRTYEAWHRVEAPEPYAQTVLVRVFLSMRRRRMHAERPTDVVPETSSGDRDPTVRITLDAALARLAPIDRAVLVLRFLCDRSVEQVATDLGRSSASVRTMTSRALTRLRSDLGPTGLAELGFHPEHAPGSSTRVGG